MRRLGIIERTAINKNYEVFFSIFASKIRVNNTLKISNFEAWQKRIL
jgi:hypothetical protein